MTVEIQGLTIVAEIEIEAAPETVFDAFTDPGQLASWWGSAETYRTSNWQIDLRAGGKWSCEARNAEGAMTVHGVYLEVDPPRKVAYTWNPAWDPGPETEIHITLEPRGSGTLVRLVHSGFEGREKSQQGHAQGWSRVLGWLQQHIQSKEN